MNGIEHAPLVDTNRAELRERIGEARARFDRLVRAADPLARAPGSAWTVQETVAHVVSLGRGRYLALARDGQYRYAANPREHHALNQAELEAAMAPVPELADQLHEIGPELDAYFDANCDDQPTIPYHAFGFMSGLTAQTNWLGELLLHGEDIANAVKSPWKLSERDMLLVARGFKEMAPCQVRRDAAANADVSVAFEVPGARPYTVRVNHGAAEMHARRTDDRPDAVLRLPASTLVQLIYQRISPFTAVRRGLRIVGGRRPWVALRLMSYFEQP